VAYLCLVRRLWESYSEAGSSQAKGLRLIGCSSSMRRTVASCRCLSIRARSNLALEYTFDWFAVRYQAHIIWFGREEYGGERDVLLLPCELVDFERRKAFLWTPTTAARSRPDPWVVELVCDIGLRDTYRLQDGDVLGVELPVQDNAALTSR
jgi:hypothetical protein